MAYIVKYIGSISDIADLTSLYSQDLLAGHRAVFVGTLSQTDRFLQHNIPLLTSVADIVNTAHSVMAVCLADKSAEFAVEAASDIYAAECQVYIQRDGIYTADRNDTDLAVKLERIDYDEVIELCNSGYAEVDMDMVEKAKKLGVILRVLSWKKPKESGTIVKEVMAFGSATVKGIIKEPDICIVSLREIPDIPGISYHIFDAVSNAGINVDMISLPASDYGRQDISFTIHKEDKEAAERVLREKQAELGYSDVIIKDNVAKISVVGSGVKTSKGVAAGVFRVLYENNISLRLISTSEIKINVFVEKSDADLAVQKIHQQFIK